MSHKSGVCPVQCDIFIFPSSQYFSSFSQCLPGQQVLPSRFYLSHSVTVGSVCFTVWGGLRPGESETQASAQQQPISSAGMICAVQCTLHNNSDQCLLRRGVHCLTVKRKNHDIMMLAKQWQWPVYFLGRLDTASDINQCIKEGEGHKHNKKVKGHKRS